MKINKNVLGFMLCLVLCFCVAYSASAASMLSPKQLLIAKLKSSDSKSDLYKMSSGTAIYKIKALDGSLVSAYKPLRKLNDAEAKLDYKLNSPAKKLQANYSLSLNNGKPYSGNVFLDNDKFIMSTEIFSLIKEFDPSMNLSSMDIPQYAYTTDRQFAQMWENLIQGTSVPPEFEEILIFLLEAVPDKYFTTSITSQKLTFSLNQQGLEDVVLAIAEKVKNEPEKFADLVAGAVASQDKTKTSVEIKQGILTDLEKSIKDGSFPNAEELKMFSLFITLEQLSFETSLLPSGPGKFTMAGTFNFDGTTGRLTVDADFPGSGENLSGDYTAVLTINNKEMKIVGELKGDIKRTAGNEKSNGSIKVNVADSGGTMALLNFALEAQSDSRVDPGVEIKTPVLTAANSKNFEDFEQFSSRSKIEIVKVVIDGQPVIFDVAPFIQDGKRTVVPLRGVAEALGCEVEWVEPDQINIYRDDISLTMHINQHFYTVNGVEKEIDVAPFIKDGKRALVPIRFIAEELGCRVEYDGATQSVYIYSK